MSQSIVRRWLSFGLAGLVLVGLAQLTSPPAAIAVPPAPKVGQATANVGWFEQSKYGIFVHYVQGLTIRADGSSPANVDTLAAEFNASQFAADVNSFGADYVVFTAWHLAMRPLYPSAVHESWRPGQSSERLSRENREQVRTLPLCTQIPSNFFCSLIIIAALTCSVRS